MIGTEPATPATPGTRQVLSAYVDRKVTRLQQQYLADVSSAAASLARLRRAVNRGPGEDPTVWAETFDGFPAELLGRGDRPSRHERAAHAAITLFAVHQQSKDRAMHRQGFGIGAAARKLGTESNSEEAVLRRFQTLGTSTSFEETVYHARALITQFRSHGLGIDYGRLAADLADIQNEHRADRVRLAWGRDYYRVTDRAADPARDTDTRTTSDN
ncbi:MAG TPA: type I-E CRISPR-associated protein Cse2/CasB [Aldersonia sp.]